MLFAFILFITAIFSPLPQNLYADKVELNSLQESINLYPFIEIVEGKNNDNEDILQILKSNGFKILSEIDPDYDAPVHWIRFHLRNKEQETKNLKVTVVFTDEVTFYALEGNSVKNIQYTGDLTPIQKRSVPLGQLVAAEISVPGKSSLTCYVKLKSKTKISQQFREITLNSLNLYSEVSFRQRFIEPTMYHSFFYGALVIMLFYNFIIFLSLKDKSYLYYVLFIFFLILFLAAGNGHLAESTLKNYPRTDLYLRFLSAPVLMIFYILFSRSYLKVKIYLPRYDLILIITIGLFLLFMICMLTGYWFLGRNLGVYGTILSFVLVFVLALKILLKGYTPSRYFLAANSLLIIGGVIYALQRISVVVQNPATQYSIQIAAVLEVAIFSLGLADRINLIKNELILKKLENEKLEKTQEIEKKKIIEEKNRELEIKVLERTSEIVEQKEEIETQKEILEWNNKQLETAKEVISGQNKKLKNVNKELEKKVRKRTIELEATNENLQKAIFELDHFIYRTAHDIRGPLARLMGLCNVALLDVQDKTAVDYLQRLEFNANNLNYILSRLSSIHEIKSQEIKREEIDFDTLLSETTKKLKFMEGSEEMDYNYTVENDLRFHSDKNMLRFIIINLLENALKFRDTSGTRKPYIAFNVSKVQETLLIRIADNGKGIEKENYVTLFQMFSPTAGIHKTPGLGLYMVKICVERLSGIIGLNETAHPITEFEISIPYQSL